MTSFCCGWFLTFYANYIPFRSVLNIIDIFLNEPEKILYRVGLAIFKLREEKLLKAGSSLEKILYCFK
jgi:hypothetical protein